MRSPLRKAASGADASGPAAPTARELRRRHPALRSAWWGAGFALTGTETFEVLVLMLTTAAYGAVLSVGALGFALRIAPMLLAPALTAALDRRPERRARFARLTVPARAVGIGLFAAVLLLPGAPSWILYVLVGAVSALDTAYLSATRATLPRILEDAEEPGVLGRANAMLVVQWNTLQILVPPAVVWVLQATGVSVVVAVAVALLLAAFALLGRYERAYPADAGPESASPPDPFWNRFTAGFRAIRGDAVARAVVVSGAAGQGAIFTFSVAVPQVVDPAEVGITLSALAVGSIVGARLASRAERPAAQYAALAGATAALGGSLAAFALSAHPAVVLSAALAAGACAGAAAVARTTLLQRRFADARLGGVVVSAMVLGQVLMPFLPQAWDLIAERAAAGWAFVLLAALQFAALAFIALGLRPGGAARAALREAAGGGDDGGLEPRARSQDGRTGDPTRGGDE
ncbi:hypothetical protein O4J56_09745 [Nocardiopsis sp. RSe5-2]|uniref:MFS transporter n=1 Tax=Nocardiopsis endophytica TaxID=3018445 RepID=A0ABT4U1U3_9ACTN|nr:hypothetical protein [Nocardiopsis endophytica]MDA2810917.1 hypothetical protein [Nocardiopsis endophytica]